MRLAPTYSERARRGSLLASGRNVAPHRAPPSERERENMQRTERELREAAGLVAVTVRHALRTFALSEAMDDASRDPWGATLAALGAACDVLHEVGGDVPESAGYSPGMSGPVLDEFPTCEVWAEWTTARTSAERRTVRDDLERDAELLAALASLIDRDGVSY